MNELESKKSKPKKEPRCEPKQLELLLECSRKKDITEWNNWRSDNPEEEIWLQLADLSGAHLEGGHLGNAHLEGANLLLANLKGVNLVHAHMKRALLRYADLKGASLWDVYLEGADISEAHLEEADFGAYFAAGGIMRAHLEGANLRSAHLEGARLDNAHLEKTDFRTSVVDGLTLFWNCYVDRKTDFRGVGLDTCRIDEGTKHLLEYNIRRLNWEDWYTGESGEKWVRALRQFLTCPVRLFWLLSDYGRSTARILLVFLALAIIFAVVYWQIPDCVMVNGQVGGLRNFLHALYFSVVTMTTGDIAANPQSSLGQVLVMLQLFCGYFLLGAIVTRLAILFTAGGPAGRFSKKEK